MSPERKLRGFLIHLSVYFAISGLAFVANMIVTPEARWFLLPMIGWGSVLALHVAYVMGLFDVFFKK